ncbi:MAG: tryptophan 2,3-dioxygenase family protein, partial [Bacteroidota bacterium]
LQTVVHRLERIVTILQVLVHQIDIMETMTPMDFLDFRDMLRPASGFQSWQFKELEAKLGLKFEQRHGQEYYTSQLRKEHVSIIKEAENKKSLLQHVNAWLERMPFFDSDKNFWSDYRKQYESSLAAEEKNNLATFDEMFSDIQSEDNLQRTLSPSACRAALFIML